MSFLYHYLFILYLCIVGTSYIIIHILYFIVCIRFFDILRVYRSIVPIVMVILLNMLFHFHVLSNVNTRTLAHLLDYKRAVECFRMDFWLTHKQTQHFVIWIWTIILYFIMEHMCVNNTHLIYLCIYFFASKWVGESVLYMFVHSFFSANTFSSGQNY